MKNYLLDGPPELCITLCWLLVVLDFVGCIYWGVIAEQPLLKLKNKRFFSIDTSYIHAWYPQSSPSNLSWHSTLHHPASSLYSSFNFVLLFLWVTHSFYSSLLEFTIYLSIHIITYLDLNSITHSHSGLF